MKAKFVGEDKPLFKKSLVSGTVHSIYVTAYDQDEDFFWLSIDEETYPWKLEDLISDWEVYNG